MVDPFWGALEKELGNLERITPTEALEAIIEAAKAAFVDEEVREPEDEPVGGGVPKFLYLLQARRGAYTWTKGTSSAFRDWLLADNSIENPLPIEANINCWEGVLHSAIRAGLMSLDDVKGAYTEDDVAASLFELLKGRGITTKRLDTGNKTAAMKAGDLVLVEVVGDPMHHVMAVLEPDNDDLGKTKVMSLWSALGGGIFATVLLGEALGNVEKGSNTFRYVTL